MNANSGSWVKKIVCVLVVLLMISSPVVLADTISEGDAKHDFSNGFGGADMPFHMDNPEQTTFESLNLPKDIVDPFTGQVSFPISLFSVDGVNNLGLSLSLSYSSNYDTDHQGSESQYAGLGWSLNAGGAISINTKGTAVFSDDEYSIGGKELIPDAQGASTFHLRTHNRYTYEQISPYQWIVTDTSGNQYHYGSATGGSGVLKMPVVNGMVVDNSVYSPQASGVPVTLYLTKVNDITSNNAIIYEYEEELHNGFVNNLRLSKISDEFGRWIQFSYLALSDAYYFDTNKWQGSSISAYATGTSPSVVETASLYGPTGLVQKYTFAYTNSVPNDYGTSFKMLSSLTSGDLTYTFTYYQGTDYRANKLGSVVGPTGASITFNYAMDNAEMTIASSSAGPTVETIVPGPSYVLGQTGATIVELDWDGRVWREKEVPLFSVAAEDHEVLTFNDHVMGVTLMGEEPMEELWQKLFLPASDVAGSCEDSLNYNQMWGGPAGMGNILCPEEYGPHNMKYYPKEAYTSVIVDVAKKDLESEAWQNIGSEIITPGAGADKLKVIEVKKGNGFVGIITQSITTDYQHPALPESEIYGKEADPESFIKAHIIYVDSEGLLQYETKEFPRYRGWMVPERLRSNSHVPLAANDYLAQHGVDNTGANEAVYADLRPVFTDRVAIGNNHIVYYRLDPAGCFLVKECEGEDCHFEDQFGEGVQFENNGYMAAAFCPPVKYVDELGDVFTPAPGETITFWSPWNRYGRRVSGGDDTNLRHDEGAVIALNVPKYYGAQIIGVDVFNGDGFDEISLEEYNEDYFIPVENNEPIVSFTDDSIIFSTTYTTTYDDWQQAMMNCGEGCSGASFQESLSTGSKSRIITFKYKGITTTDAFDREDIEKAELAEDVEVINKCDWYAEKGYVGETWESCDQSWHCLTEDGANWYGEAFGNMGYSSLYPPTSDRLSQVKYLSGQEPSDFKYHFTPAEFLECPGLGYNCRAEITTDMCNAGAVNPANCNGETFYEFPVNDACEVDYGNGDVWECPRMDPEMPTTSDYRCAGGSCTYVMYAPIVRTDVYDQCVPGDPAAPLVFATGSATDAVCAGSVGSPIYSTFTAYSGYDFPDCNPTENFPDCWRPVRDLIQELVDELHECLELQQQDPENHDCTDDIEAANQEIATARTNALDCIAAAWLTFDINCASCNPGTLPECFEGAEGVYPYATDLIEANWDIEQPSSTLVWMYDPNGVGGGVIPGFTYFTTRNRGRNYWFDYYRIGGHHPATGSYGAETCRAYSLYEDHVSPEGYIVGGAWNPPPEEELEGAGIDEWMWPEGVSQRSFEKPDCYFGTLTPVYASGHYFVDTDSATVDHSTNRLDCSLKRTIESSPYAGSLFLNTNVDHYMVNAQGYADDSTTKVYPAGTNGFVVLNKQAEVEDSNVHYYVFNNQGEFSLKDVVLSSANSAEVGDDFFVVNNAGGESVVYNAPRPQGEGAPTGTIFTANADKGMGALFNTFVGTANNNLVYAVHNPRTKQPTNNAVVVDEVIIDDGVQRTLSYEYIDGKLDKYSVLPQFQRAIVTLVSGGQTISKTEYDFYNGVVEQALDVTGFTALAAADKPLAANIIAGKPIQVVSKYPDNDLSSKTEYSYEILSALADRAFEVRTTQKIETIYEGQNDLSKTTNYEYSDVTGLPSHISMTGGAYTKHTYTEYAAEEDPNHQWFLANNVLTAVHEQTLSGDQQHGDRITQITYHATGPHLPSAIYVDNDLVAEFVTYDGKGRVTEVANEAGITYNFVYDNTVNPTSVTSGIYTTGHTYNDRGQTVTVTDYNSDTTTYTYDGLGRLTSMLMPGEVTPAFTVDYFVDHTGANNKIVTTTNFDAETSSTTTSNMDSGGRVLLSEHSDGVNAYCTRSSYSVFGVEEKSTYSVAACIGMHLPTTYSYEVGPQGRLLSMWLPDNSEITHEYEIDEVLDLFVTRVIDPLNRVTESYSNMLGLTEQVVQPDDTVIESEHNVFDEVITVTDARDLEKNIEYDNRGRVTSTSHPDTSTMFTQYNEYGVDSIQGPNRNVDYDYDTVLGRLLSLDYDNEGTTYNNAIHTREYHYDDYPGGANCPNGIGRVCQIEDTFYEPVPAKYRERFMYDDRGRVSSEQIRMTVKLPNNQEEVFTKVIQYTYDNQDNLISESIDGGDLFFDYDAFNRLKFIKYGDFTAVTYDYLDNDNPMSRTDRNTGDGISTAYTYDDERGWITGMSNNLFSYSYSSYDSVGNLLQMSKPGTLGTASFTYDDMDKISTAHSDLYDFQSGTRNYLYDDNGNRERAEGYTYNIDTLSNRVLGIDDINNAARGPEQVSYIYDAHGNVQSRIEVDDLITTTYTYEYDPNNKLIRVIGESNANTILEEVYWNNGAGQRIVKSQFDLVNTEYDYTLYWYDAFGQLIAETTFTADQFGNIVGDELDTYYMYAGLNRVAKMCSDYCTGNVRYFHSDHLGSSSVVTDNNGATVWSSEYLPFGMMDSTTGTEDNEYAYTGKEYDGDTGLYYYGARHYDPLIGRFMSVDGVDPTPNPYSYVSNNPMKYIDPTGNVGEGAGSVFYGSSYVSQEARVTANTQMTDFAKGSVEVALDTYGDAFALATGKSVFGEDVGRGWAAAGLVIPIASGSSMNRAIRKIIKAWKSEEYADYSWKKAMDGEFGINKVYKHMLSYLEKAGRTGKLYHGMSLYDKDVQKILKEGRAPLGTVKHGSLRKNLEFVVNRKFTDINNLKDYQIGLKLDDFHHDLPYDSPLISLTTSEGIATTWAKGMSGFSDKNPYLLEIDMTKLNNKIISHRHPGVGEFNTMGRIMPSAITDIRKLDIGR